MKSAFFICGQQKYTTSKSFPILKDLIKYVNTSFMKCKLSVQQFLEYFIICSMLLIILFIIVENGHRSFMIV